MRLIRDDAQEKVKLALTILNMARTTSNPEILKQHLDGIERVLVMLESSMKGDLSENRETQSM